MPGQVPLLGFLGGGRRGLPPLGDAGQGPLESVAVTLLVGEPRGQVVPVRAEDLMELSDRVRAEVAREPVPTLGRDVEGGADRVEAPGRLPHGFGRALFDGETECARPSSRSAARRPPPADSDRRQARWISS